MTRWVIVAQMTRVAHAPDVFGAWETEEAAEAQMKRWESRIERTTDADGFYPDVILSVEPLDGKRGCDFDRVFAFRTHRTLAR
jgi:hypothetical protein